MNNKHMEATLLDWIRSVVETYHDWIELALGVPVERANVFHVVNSLSSLAAQRVLTGVPLTESRIGPTKQLRERVKAVEFPPATPLTMLARTVNKPGTCITEQNKAWDVTWGDTPVALRFQGLRGAVIAISLAYSDQRCTNWAQLVICRQDEAAAVMELLQCRQDTSVLFTSGKQQEVNKLKWDDLVLDPTVLQLVKNDYESFFDRQDWFRQHNLPFRRGYLLHGFPGNGKTSVIRAMLSRPGMHGFAVDFFAQRMGDEVLQFIFHQAFECAPSLIVLEDIDRAFPLNQFVRCNIALPQLLNCLDGLATQDGLIVVATANDPSALDPAILKRPGRFDRVVAFPNPNAELRAKYFRKLNADFGDEDVEHSVVDSDGFSFAQLREAYILAAQYAYERDQDVKSEDLREAVHTLRNGFSADSRKHSAGFGMNSLVSQSEHKTGNR